MKFSATNKILLVYAMVAAMFCEGCINDDHQTSDQTTLVKIGQTAPDFTVEMLDGSNITLSDLRGDVVLLTLFDPECPSCQKEMAVAQSQIIDRIAGKGIHYLPISRGYDRKTIEDYCRINGYTFPMGLDPDKSIYLRYATKFVPRSFVIDRKGVIRYLYVEYELDSLPEILSAAEHLAM